MSIAKQKVQTFEQDNLTECALDVANACLSRTGAAISSGDVQALAECFALPHTLQTFDGVNVLRTVADIERVFDGLRRHLVRKSVTQTIRNCLSAEFDGIDRIKFTHETRFMNGVQLVQDPFPCLSTLVRLDGYWLIRDTTYAVVNESNHVDALMGRRATT